ncbi:MAG TPA: hypothetical protein VFF44_12050 [Casimicrobiaceae bacterium]|nr:hypothetical protein [Casimicrobiaceae bacterium]
MRCIAKLGTIAVAATLAGCQFTGAYHDAGYRLSADPYTAEIKPRAVYPQYVLTFPDETMYFYPMYQDDPRHADLKLDSMVCVVGTDGHLVVAANVKNLGSNIVPSIPLLSGDMGAFRVTATATTASGAREQVYATQYVPLTVTGAATLVLSPLAVPPADVVRIDVEADPDRIVPDPLRDNNVLSWEGTMSAAAPQCTVRR